ncbi:AAA family ATPase [Streptomyces sp. NPDC021100]|uniref:AAA family ATPase n=1 Tax=Streptomyces sp. NPDC021100 TaxID=3365114 RepID=UPI0037B0C5BE
MTDTITHPPQPGASAAHLIPNPRYQFAPAVRQQRKARIVLDGPPGSGTTYTSLALATAIGTRVAVVDTQRGKSGLYAQTFTFDACPPLTYFSPETLVTALAHCADQGYDTVVIATLSSFWSGPGGVLEQVALAAKRGPGGTKGGWDETRPRERRMLDALFGYPGHVIVTVRDKLDYVCEPDDTGRQARRIIGLGPIWRDGLEYEFDIVATMDHSHTLVVVKAPTPDLCGAVRPEPGALFAAEIKEWLDTGEPAPAADDLVTEARQPSLTFEELGDLMHRVRLRQAEGHPLLLPDGNGTTLGAYIMQRGNDLRGDR